MIKTPPRVKKSDSNPFINHQPATSHNLRSVGFTNGLWTSQDAHQDKSEVKFFQCKNLIKIGSSTAPIH